MVPVCFCRCWGRKEVFILIVLFVVIKQAYCCFRFRFWLCFNFRQLWLNSRRSKQPSSLFLIFITEQTSPWFWLAWLGGRGRLCFNCRFLGWWSHFGLTQEASVILLEATKKECSRTLPFENKGRKVGIKRKMKRRNGEKRKRKIKGNQHSKLWPFWPAAVTHATLANCVWQ